MANTVNREPFARIIALKRSNNGVLGEVDRICGALMAFARRSTDYGCYWNQSSLPRLSSMTRVFEEVSTYLTSVESNMSHNVCFCVFHIDFYKS